MAPLRVFCVGGIGGGSGGAEEKMSMKPQVWAIVDTKHDEMVCYAKSHDYCIISFFRYLNYPVLPCDVGCVWNGLLSGRYRLIQLTESK